MPYWHKLCNQSLLILVIHLIYIIRPIKNDDIKFQKCLTNFWYVVIQIVFNLHENWCQSLPHCLSYWSGSLRCRTRTLAFNPSSGTIRYNFYLACFLLHLLNLTYLIFGFYYILTENVTVGLPSSERYWVTTWDAL